MTARNSTTYGMESLETHAAVLNAICEPDPLATPCYEIMSGALVWTDEKHPSLTSDIIFSLRQLWNFRTRCILQDERPENDFVARCVILFPNWIGFLPERWIPTPAALAEYRRGDVSLRWCLRHSDCDEKNENK